MKITKLPSGSYRVQKMVDGKRYSLTFEKRPTQKEIDAAINERTCGAYTGRKTFEQCSNEYIQDRKNVLSPATSKEYSNRLKGTSDRFKNLAISQITNQELQKELNWFAGTHSPKTTKNQYLFISAILGAYREDFRIKVKLPTEEVKAPYIPTEDDVKALLNYTKNSQLELIILLAIHGLRRGEICALTDSDLEGNKLTINKDKVRNMDNKWIIKPTPKTKASNRTIYVSDRVVELVHEFGFYDGNPDNLYSKIIKAEKACGLPKFSLHKCRHYFASVALQTMPEADVQKYGGWSTDGTMKRIYRHTMSDRSKDISNVIVDSIS